MTNREANLKDKQIKWTEKFEIKYDGVKFRFPEVNFAGSRQQKRGLS